MTIHDMMKSFSLLLKMFGIVCGSDVPETDVDSDNDDVVGDGDTEQRHGDLAQE